MMKSALLTLIFSLGLATAEILCKGSITALSITVPHQPFLDPWQSPATSVNPPILSLTWTRPWAVQLGRAGGDACNFGVGSTAYQVNHSIPTDSAWEFITSKPLRLFMKFGGKSKGDKVERVDDRDEVAWHVTKLEARVDSKTRIGTVRNLILDIIEDGEVTQHKFDDKSFDHVNTSQGTVATKKVQNDPGKDWSIVQS